MGFPYTGETTYLYWDDPQGLCWTSEAYRVLAQISGPWFSLLMLSRSPLLSMVDFSRIIFCLKFLQQFRDDDQVICIQVFLYETFGRGLREPWWTIGVLGKSLGELPLSHWTPHSDCNKTSTLLLAFSYMLYIRRTSHSSTPSMPRRHQMTRLGTRSSAFSRRRWCCFQGVLCHPLQNSHDLVQQFEASVICSLKGDAFALVRGDNDNLLGGDNDTLVPFGRNLPEVDDILD